VHVCADRHVVRVVAGLCVRCVYVDFEEQSVVCDEVWEIVEVEGE
jgi:hypothetical protein